MHVELANGYESNGSDRLQRRVNCRGLYTSHKNYMYRETGHGNSEMTTMPNSHKGPVVIHTNHPLPQALLCCRLARPHRARSMQSVLVCAISAAARGVEGENCVPAVLPTKAASVTFNHS